MTQPPPPPPQPPPAPPPPPPPRPYQRRSKNKAGWFCVAGAVLIGAVLTAALLFRGPSPTTEMGEFMEYLEANLEIESVGYARVWPGEVKRALIQFPGPAEPLEVRNKHFYGLVRDRLHSVWVIQMPSEKAALRRVNPNRQRDGKQWSWGWFFFEGDPRDLPKIKNLLE